MRIVALTVFVSVASAWAPSHLSPRASRTTMRMALDYNDPVVTEEFNNVQPLSYEDVEEELLESGIRAPSAMNEMEIRLMLVEMRLRKSGRMPGSEAEKTKKKPTKFSSKFEEALYNKPAFAEFYSKIKAKGDHNAENVIKEFLQDPDLAQKRYGSTYKGLLRNAHKAMTAPPPVKTKTLQFSGFPANMGPDACKMTLNAVGEIEDFKCEESDDLPILTGTVTFSDIESAKKAVEQYSGMDMGMGMKLELTSV